MFFPAATIVLTYTGAYGKIVVKIGKLRRGATGAPQTVARVEFSSMSSHLCVNFSVLGKE